MNLKQKFMTAKNKIVETKEKIEKFNARTEEAKKQRLVNQVTAAETKAIKQKEELNLLKRLEKAQNVNKQLQQQKQKLRPSFEIPGFTDPFDIPSKNKKKKQPNSFGLF